MFRHNDQVKLGQKVRDTITGLEGTVVARTEWLYGCVRVTVQLEVVKAKAPPSGGPRGDEGSGLR